MGKAKTLVAGLRRVEMVQMRFYYLVTDRLMVMQ